MGVIKKAKELVDQAVVKLKRYQKGLDKPIKTGFPHLDENMLGGIFSGNIMTIAGKSGSGKSYLLQQIEDAMFNRKLNPQCDEYVLLRCNYEMSVFKIVLRKLKKALDKSMKSILFEEVKEYEKPAFEATCNEESNDNIYYMQEPDTPDDWYESVKVFLEEHKDKKQVLITIDHIALVKDILGSKKKAMDNFIEKVNLLKRQFDNVSFIILSQLNRDIEGRTDPRNMAPLRSDLYNSDTIYQISDLVLVIHNPYKDGIDKYMVVGKSKYDYLEEHKQTPQNNTSNFYTFGRIFWHYLKIREIEDLEELQDLHIEVINPNVKVEKVDQREVEKENLFMENEDEDGFLF